MESQIIEFVRDHPVLYDKKFRGYKNNVLKEKLWQELAVICNIAGEYFLFVTFYLFYMIFFPFP